MQDWRPVPHVGNFAVGLSMAGICATFDLLGLRRMEETRDPRAEYLCNERTRVLVMVSQLIPPFGFGGVYIDQTGQP